MFLTIMISDPLRLTSSPNKGTQFFANHDIEKSSENAMNVLNYNVSSSAELSGIAEMDNPTRKMDCNNNTTGIEGGCSIEDDRSNATHMSDKDDVREMNPCTTCIVAILFYMIAAVILLGISWLCSTLFE